MDTKNIIAALGVLALFSASGCVLGPQPEPPDVTDSPTARGDEDSDTWFSGDYDDGLSDGAYAEDPGPCDPGLAGGEWNCGADRDGHEPPCGQDEDPGEVVTGRVLMLSVADRILGNGEDPDPDTYFDELDPGDDDDGNDDDDDDGDDIGVVDY